MKYLHSITLVIFAYIFNVLKAFDPYVSNQSQSLGTDLHIKWREANKDSIYLQDLDVNAYYIYNAINGDTEEQTYYPAIQTIQNGQQLGDPIKLIGEDLKHEPNGLSLCSTGENSFVLFFTVPNDDQMTWVDETEEKEEDKIKLVEYYEQHIKFVHFSRFNSQMKPIQSQTINVAINPDISFDRPKCAYVPSEEKVIFIYGDQFGQKIYRNTIYLGENRKYELEHDIQNGEVFIQSSTVDDYIDRFEIAQLSDESGYLVTYSERPHNIFDDDIYLKLKVKKFSGQVEEIVDDILPSQKQVTLEDGNTQINKHKWTFDPKIAVNTPKNKFILSWWEDLSVRYKIYDFQYNKICDDEIHDAQKPSVTTWGDLGLISFRNSTGNFIYEINLDTCKLHIDKLKELYNIWGEGDIAAGPVDIRIQKGQEVALQVIFQDKGSSEIQQLSYNLEQCPPGCGDCDNPTECNACVPSRRNPPSCDICNDGYVEKNNECFLCQELYGSQCNTCNEFNCICEGRSIDCDKCVGLFRDVKNNCACIEGFQEDLVTKQCEFIPCQKGYYEYSYRCLECYWIKGSDVCYEGQCPTFYFTNEETGECYQEKTSLTFLFIFGGLAFIIIIITIIFIKRMHEKSKQIQNQPILKVTDRQNFDTTTKPMGQPESDLDLTKHKQSISSIGNQNIIQETGQ